MSELLSPAPVPTLTKSKLSTETIVNNNSSAVIKQQLLQQKLIREETITQEQENANEDYKRTSTDSVTSTQTTDTTSSIGSINETSDGITENTTTTIPELTATAPESPVEIRVTSPGVVETTLKRRSIMGGNGGSDDDDLLDPGIRVQNDAAEEELHIETDDPSHLFWVPAHLHPEIAPNEFRKWLQNHAKDGFNAGPGSLRRRKSTLSHQYIPPENGDVEDEDSSRIVAKIAKKNENPVDGFDWESYGASEGNISPTSESSKLNILRRSLSLNLTPFMESSIFDQYSSPNVDSDVLVPRMAPALKRAARTKIRRNSVAGAHDPRKFSAHRRTKSTHIVSEKQKQAVPGASSLSLSHKLSQSNNESLVGLKIGVNNGEGSTIENNNNEEKDTELAPEPRRTSSLSPNAIEVGDTLQEGRIPISEQTRISLNVVILSKKIMSGKISPTSPTSTTAETATNTQIIKRSSTWSSWLPWSGNPEETRAKKLSKSHNKEAKIDREAKIEKVKFVDNKPIKEVENNNVNSIETVVKEKSSKISFSSIFPWNNKTKVAEDAFPSSTASTSTPATAATTAAATVQVINKKPKYTNYNRLPIHMERAIYRLSHVKLANPRRPLHEQVLISNMMFWYLSLINKQQAEYGGNHPQADKEAKKVKSKVGKERGGKRKRNNKQAGQSRRVSEIAYKAPQYDMQQAQIAQQYLSPHSPSAQDVSGSSPFINGAEADSTDENSDCESGEEFPAHTYHHYNNGYTSDGTSGGYLEDDNNSKKKMTGDLSGANGQQGHAENNGKGNSNEENANGSKNINNGNYKRPPPNTRPISNAGRPVSPNGRPKSPNGRSISPTSNSASRRSHPQEANRRPINSAAINARSPSAGSLLATGVSTGSVGIHDELSCKHFSISLTRPHETLKENQVVSQRKVSRMQKDFGLK
ncbi:7041_t:CDS:2 [Ambispora gerdemannii]|uniref:7041_t:CDS:1 n=1 Tax=Ambispora gerdemannii TaxID=144530 RepID=A0A9N9GJS5_9GLOM|nr:7041_t:CDS:2 [Ambispora gerdemannii]